MSDTILLLEDSEPDATLAIRALARSGLRNPAAWMQSTEEGYAYLKSCRADLPLLILLDLDFKGKQDGLSFLRKIRSKPEFKHIPVIVLTVSRDTIIKTFGLGAVAHLVKPVSAFRLLESIQPLELGWKLVLESP